MRLLRQTPLPHVIHHSDNREPVLIPGLRVVFEGKALSEGIATWPEGSRHTPTDDRDTRTGRVVLVPKSSAAQQPDSHHPKVIRTHGGLIHHVAMRHWPPVIEMKESPTSLH